MIDTHTHTKFSADSLEEPRKLIEKAISLGIKYLAITDHVDRDYLFGDIRPVEQINMHEYYPAIKVLSEEYADDITILIGAEFGYAKSANHLYQEIAKNFNLDIIINSVHTIDGKDAYFPEFFIDKEKKDAYISYLAAIKESIDVDYQYDVIAHIGYITRNAPYPDKALYYNEYKETIDEILQLIIKKGKALEINSRSISHNTPFMPCKEIITRYKELGGELITFGSDAHKYYQVGKGYWDVVQFLKSLGYNHLTYFIKHKPYAYTI